MSKRRKCKNFAWRDEDPAWIAERQNDRIVFHKIRREVKRTNDRPLRVIERLANNPMWSSLLDGKSLESWKRKYNQWLRKNTINGLASTQKWDDVQAKKSSFDH